MPPSYLPLRCGNGECQHVISGTPDQCPTECSLHTQCAQCLATPKCGWCAFGGLNGRGVCMEGGLTKAHHGQCNAQNVTLGNQPLPGMHVLQLRSYDTFRNLSLVSLKLCMLKEHSTVIFKTT